MAGLVHLLASPLLQRSGVEYITDSIGCYTQLGADDWGGWGWTENSSSRRFFLLDRWDKQFPIWNFVTKVLSTVPSFGLNMNGLSRVWPMSQRVIVIPGAVILLTQCIRWRFIRGFKKMGLLDICSEDG